MPQAPNPITSPPAVPGQPYDASDSGAGDPQCAPTTIYNKAGGTGSGEPWVKIRDGGAATDSGASQPGSWPADGSSDGSAWRQT